MSATTLAPGPQQKRLAAYLDGLAQAAGHADRFTPLKNYCQGLLMDGERKSVEPMAARLAPDDVRRTHQSLHHLVAEAPWREEELLRQVREYVLPAMEKKSPIVAWIVDDTGIPKKGRHSVGVARQYCGQVGKPENCQVAVSLTVASWHSSLPVGWRLYLPQSWTEDEERRQKAKIPAEVQFQTKPRMALEQIRQAVKDNIAVGVVLADAAYGNDSQFRAGITELGLEYLVGVQATTSVRMADTQLPAKRRKKKGGGKAVLSGNEQQQPVSVQQLALSLESSAWKKVSWREGTKGKLSSRFAAVRVRPAQREEKRTEPAPAEWLLMEWPASESEPTKYWLSSLPGNAKLKNLVKLAKHRWIIERDYEELKQEVGLSHYEGRGWLGFHHHATLCIAAYGFLIAERNRFSPSARVGHLGLRPAKKPAAFRPRGSPSSSRAA